MSECSLLISFVSPVYNSEKNLEKLVTEIQKVMLKINGPYEIILVDDRSTDNSWEQMKIMAAKISNLEIIRLSRNFGQHPTIMAGLTFAKGEWVIVLDCDLQDQPKEVLKLFNKTKEGYDVVLAQRKVRHDSFLKRQSSIIYSKLYGYLTETNRDYQVANFGIYHKKVISAILSLSDYIKNFPLFVTFVGFKQTSIEVEHGSRFEGKSTYNFSKLLNLAFNSMISFSNKPLKLFVKFGMIISIISFLFGVYNIYLALTDKIDVLGYSSIIISIWFLSGIIITIVGVCGIYIGKSFNQVKNRPVFIIDEIK